MTHAGLTRDLEDRLERLEALAKALQDALDAEVATRERLEYDAERLRDQVHRREFDRWDRLAERVDGLEIRVRRIE